LGIPVIVFTLSHDEIGRIDYPFDLCIAWSGVCLIFLGVWLRWYALKINKFFTRNLRIGEGQFIVTEGILNIFIF